MTFGTVAVLRRFDTNSDPRGPGGGPTRAEVW